MLYSSAVGFVPKVQGVQSMSINCTRCNGTGFLNVEQIPSDVFNAGHESVLEWLSEKKSSAERLGGCSCHINPPCSFCVDQTDVSVCDCCGDGEGWYGEPGRHYSSEDPKGPSGPYAYNGGLCECH